MRRNRNPVARRTLPLPRPGTPPLPKVPQPVRWTLDNGLRVVAVPRRALPQVAMRVLLPAGAVADPAEHPGTAALVGGMLTEGTLTMTAEALNLQLDSLGASVNVQVGHDFTEVDLFLLSETLGEGVGLLAELLLRPAFPEAEVERARAETLDALEARGDEPANVADDRTGIELFGVEHPYGRLTMGTREGVETVGLQALSGFHARHYRPEGSVLVVAGDFELDALRRLLDAAFGQWSGRAAPLVYPEPPRVAGSAGRRVDVAWDDAAQGEIRFAGLGIPRSHPDWVAAAVANYLLGGSTITGRLGANLREDKGWTYGVRSGFAAAVHPGGWVIDTAVDGEVVDDAVAEILLELERFVGEPLPEDELQRAKDALILSLPRAFETPGRIVGRLATVEAFGLEQDYWTRFPERVAAVTTEEVTRVARAYFDPRALVQVIVGPEEA